MKRLTVGCDMDGILVDLTTHWLEQIAKDTGVRVGLHEIDQWSLHKCGALKTLPPDLIYGYLQKPGFFRDAPPLAGAIDSLREIAADHNIVIVSSPAGPVSAKEKYEWLAEHCPFIPVKNVILANQKTLMRLDVLIDDHPQTVIEYADAWGGALVIGIGYEYNVGVQEKHRRLVMLRDGYKDPARSWSTIQNLIASRAGRGAL